jgi:hypothetical protein
MKKYILTDLDNTVFSFAPHFEDWAVRSGYNIRRGQIDQTYDFADMFYDEIDVDAMLTDFFACDDTMGSFPALPNTVEPIQRLHEKGYSFVGITACNPREGLQKVRHDNLKNVFGFDFSQVYVTGLDRCKSFVLDMFEPTIWVEDNWNHAVAGAHLGHTTFLIDYEYNRGDGPFQRVTDWLAIEEHIDALR